VQPAYQRSYTALNPLLRHYSRLGARVFDFSVDPGFGGSVDALIVVDMAAAPRAMRERYVGPGAARVIGASEARQVLA
jgi:hypothetical protein